MSAGTRLPWLPGPDRMAVTPCKRGCCWTPFGHAGSVVVCDCHPFEKEAPRGR